MRQIISREVAKPQLSYLEAPRYVSPINALSGLYVLVLASESCEAKQLLDFVRRDVEASGYNPDGRGQVGWPSEHGIVSRSYAMWFYQKKGDKQ